MASIAAAGWDTIDTCDPAVSVIVEPARSAMLRCVAGGMTRSSVPTTAQLGMVFQAAVSVPAVLICLAGAAPSTRQSGKHKAVTFRWAVSKQLRDAVCDFADGSRHASPWAARIYNDAIARGKDHPHAVRILARAWLYVIWDCWHNGNAYDPARHRALQHLLTAQHTAAHPAA